jgi:dolichol-phosphate mannosyltransferase
MTLGHREQQGIRLSAALPVFAETDSVRELVDTMVDLLGERLHEVILVISRRSPPESFAACEELAGRHPRVRVSEQKHYPGLGLAVRQGIEECTGTHILLMDSDGEMDVRTVPPMLALLERDDLDMVVASRWMKGGGTEGYDPLKYCLNLGYQKLFKALFRTRISDLTLGFKLARAEVLQGFEWQGQYHEIGCETTLRPIRAGYRVGQVPTVWRQRKQGRSNNSFITNFRYVGMALAILTGDKRARMAERISSG